VHVSGELPTLAPRALGRVGSLVPPVIWRVTHESSPAADVLGRAAAAGADWVLFDESVAAPAVPENLPLRTIVGIDLETLVERTGQRLAARFDALPGRRCDAVLLQRATANDLKSGRPYSRLSRLRDDGRTSLLMLEAYDDAEAEWMVENTAAHAVSVPYSAGDQLVRYRVLEHARQLGVALLAREPDVARVAVAPEGDPVRFRLSDPDVTATIEPLPRDEQALRDVLTRASSPISEVERQQRWELFQQNVPEPPKPRGGHPPEFA
jgi:hypothetical protein